MPAQYRTLGPVVYLDAGVVRHVVKAGVLIFLDSAQATALAGSVEYAGNTDSPIDFPTVVVFSYPAAGNFPTQGITDYLYLDEAVGTLYRWSGTAYVVVGDGAGGDSSTNTATSVDGEVVLFSGTTGKLLKRATATGIVKLTSGVQGTAAAGTDYYAPGGTDVAIVDGGTGVSTLPSGLLKGAGTGAITAASAGTDYVTPGGALGTPSSATLTNATGLPVSGITSSTSTALGVGSIELGAASDTTISRTGAGAIAVEGTSVLLSGGALGTPSSGTLTNATGLPVAGITSSTSTALGVGSIELGAASDTTIARTGAGAISVEGVGVVLLSTGLPAANLPNGLTNGNTTRQSQVVVSATSYYIAGSNLNLPATLKTGMVTGTRFRWRVAMDKTAAGTGAFAIEIRRGTNGSVADTADVSQTIGTQTAAVDNMLLDVEMVVTTTGATGAYYWSIVPNQNAASATGFGVATGTGAYFSGTVSSVALNTTSLIFGLSFKATTGTPTITVPLVQSEAINIC